MIQTKRSFGALLVLFALLLIPLASAQETVPSDIPQELVSLAAELGCTSKEECEEKFEANFEKGLELAEKHKVYDTDKEKKELAQSFKQEILSKLITLDGASFDEEVVRLAGDLLKKKPALAKKLNVSNEGVKAAETIVQEMKSAGTTLEVCSRPADSLSREQLLRCFEASKKLSEKASVVKQYIGEERISKVGVTGNVLELENALEKGEYADLGKNADEIGTKCLRAGSESIAACDVIAERFFGPEGIKHLAEARAGVKGVEEYYKKGAENISLTTPDGRVVAGRDNIHAACDSAFETKNVALAKACGEFAVKNGFARAEDVEEGLKLFESAAKANVDFRTCEDNPEQCEQFMSQEVKGKFQTGKQIEELMKSAGADPMRCRKAEFDPEIGKECFEATKRILPQIEQLAGQSEFARNMVEGIKMRVEQGERMTQKFQEFEKQGFGRPEGGQEFGGREGGPQGGPMQGFKGPGGCAGPQECFKYCSDSANGTECIAFGAKQQVFTGNEAVERFEKYNQSLESGPTFQFQPGGEGQGSSSGQGGYQGFRPPGQGGMPPGQMGGFPGERGQGGYGGGPSPECMSAIQAGDFAKAKVVCNVGPMPAYPRSDEQRGDYHPPEGGYPNNQGTGGQYPSGDRGRYQGGSPSPDQMKQDCISHGKSPEECGQILERYEERRPPQQEGQGTSQDPRVPCPAMPTVDSCPEGEEKVPAHTSPQCGTYYHCAPKRPETKPSYEGSEQREGTYNRDSGYPRSPSEGGDPMYKPREGQPQQGTNNYQQPSGGQQPPAGGGGYQQQPSSDGGQPPPPPLPQSRGPVVNFFANLIENFKGLWE